jgi:creatinine amidohydrolase
MPIERRFELLRPRQIEQIRAAAPVAMFPFGSLEYHGRHLPVGLDAVKAHGLLLRLAERVGGVVLPPFFVGTGGGHYGYDWTIMGEPDLLRPLMANAFRKMHQFGFTVQVAVTGHYPPEQVDLLAAAAEEARRQCPGLQLWDGPEYMAMDQSIPRRADHAAMWETSIMQSLRPDLVSMTELNIDGAGRPTECPTYENDKDAFHEMNDQDTVDPLYGIWGMDPRVAAGPAIGAETVDAIVSGLAAWVREAVNRA